jgi:hypothetical protein
MTEIRTFDVDYRVEGRRLHGICRWVANSLQVEMTTPFRGLVTHCHFDYHKIRLTEGNVEGWAKHELKAIYNDIREIAKDDEDYQYFINRYRSDRFRVMRKQVELKRAYNDLEMAYSQKRISKREYRMQEWLLMDAFSHTEKQV